MVDVFTPNIRLNQQEVGAKFDLWGPPVSAGLNDGVTALIEQALAERELVDVTAGNVLLTEVDGGDDTSRPAIIRATGTPGVARTITVPDIAAGLPAQKFYILYNNSDASVSLRTVTNVGVSAAVGQSLLLMVDSVLDNVFSIALGGDAVFEAAQWQTGTMDVIGVVQPAITYRYAAQGEIGMWLFPAFSSAANPVGLAVAPNTPAVWPDEISSPISGQETAQVWVTSSADGGTPILTSVSMFGTIASRGFDPMRTLGYTTPTNYTVVHDVSIVFPLKVFEA